MWLDPWVGSGVAPSYSQDARPRGPSEGSIVHLLQVCVFLELPVGKDSVLRGVCTSGVNSHGWVCAHLEQPACAVLSHRGKRGIGEEGEKDMLVLGHMVQLLEHVFGLSPRSFPFTR